MRLIAELKRRNVFRVGAAYGVVAWLLVEVSDTVAPHMNLPEWTAALVILLLALGFPLALFLAWAYELTSEGIRKTREVPLGESITRYTGRKLDFIIIGVLAVALGWFAWDKFMREPAPPAVGPAVAREASIAVLPFVNMSPDPEQEYFSDGLSEEILNLLAQIRELTVIGRTSSFAFKGKNVDLREIGETLGVAYLLEGSVRKAGDDLRITAQLVRTDTGAHLWSESYNRKLENVFAIQGEIAGAIAAALRLSLVGSDQAAPAVQVAASMPAYERYLQARRLIQGRTREGLEAARELLAEALELDPDYAPAHAEAAKAVLLLADLPITYGGIPADRAAAEAQVHLDRALARDPNLAEAHAVQGLMYKIAADRERSEAPLARALALNPSLSEALQWRAGNLRAAGRLQEALATMSRTAELDPLNLPNLGNLSWVLAASGQPDVALEIARRVQRGFPDSPQGFMREATALATTGRLAEAEAAAVRMLALAPGYAFVEFTAGVVYFSLGEFERVAELSGAVAFGPALVALGRSDEALALARERAAAAPANIDAALGLLWTLSAAGRHEEVPDEYHARWGNLDTLDEYFGFDSQTAEMAPIAAAQSALGRREALAETLTHWGRRLAHMREHGYGSGNFVIREAQHRALSGERDAALAKLAEAIDLGYRDPLLARDPSFAPLAADPAFQAQVQRNLDLINAERAKLGLEPLP